MQSSSQSLLRMARQGYQLNEWDQKSKKEGDQKERKGVIHLKMTGSATVDGSFNGETKCIDRRRVRSYNTNPSSPPNPRATFISEPTTCKHLPSTCHMKSMNIPIPRTPHHSHVGMHNVPSLRRINLPRHGERSPMRTMNASYGNRGCAGC